MRTSFISVQIILSFIKELDPLKSAQSFADCRHNFGDLQIVPAECKLFWTTKCKNAKIIFHLRIYIWSDSTRGKDLSNQNPAWDIASEDVGFANIITDSLSILCHLRIFKAISSGIWVWFDNFISWSLTTSQTIAIWLYMILRFVYDARSEVKEHVMNLVFGFPWLIYMFS